MKKVTVYLLSALVLVLLSVLGLGAWQTVQAGGLTPTPTVSANAYQTSAVRKGSLSISAAGSGSTTALQTYDLAFSTSGTLAELKVQLGDQVSSGEELASLDTLAELQQAVANAELALQSDQKTLAELQSGGAAALAQALADQAAAEEALATAQNNLHDPHDWRCPDAITDSYYQQYLAALVAARPWQARLATDEASDKQYVLMNLNPILKKMQLAYQNYTYCQAYTAQEITDSQAALQVAQANLAAAQAAYESLKANEGVDPEKLALSQAAVKKDQLSLKQARLALQGATLSAPAAGTVTAVNGSVGQAVDTSTLLSIADPASLAVQASIDEADLGSVALGCPVEVSFTALAGKTFSGQVTQISPSLASSNGASTLPIQVRLDSGQLEGVSLPLGASATVTVTCAKTDNALLIPALALQKANDGSQYVYVLNAQNQAEKRTVTTGITNGVSVEILSGLKESEKVITSEVNIP